MPDVFDGVWPGLSVSHIRPAGARQLLVKVASDAAYYSLGAPRDVKIEDKSLTKSDGILRNLGWGFRREFTVPTIQASLTEIEMLPKLLVNTLAGFQIGLVDGNYIKNETSGLFSIRWKLNSKTDFEDFRTIEYLIAGNAKKSENQTPFSATGVTIGSPATGDVLAALAQVPVSANQVPDGVKLIEFKASTDSVYAILGDFTKAEWSFECLGPMGGGGRQLPRTHTIKFSLKVRGLQSQIAEINLMDEILDNQIDLRITHMDGVVLLMPYTNVQLAPSLTSDGNADKERGIDFVAEGALVAKNDGTDYETVGGTAWASLWS